MKTEPVPNAICPTCKVGGHIERGLGTARINGMVITKPNGQVRCTNCRWNGEEYELQWPQPESVEESPEG